MDVINTKTGLLEVINKTFTRIHCATSYLPSKITLFFLNSVFNAFKQLYLTPGKQIALTHTVTTQHKYNKTSDIIISCTHFTTGIPTVSK